MTIKKVCVIGGGLMGRQIALNTAIYPFEVTIFDANPTVLEDESQIESASFHMALKQKFCLLTV